MTQLALRLRGVVLLTAATVAWSTIGLTTRLVGTDAWTTMFWRGLFGALVIGGLVWRWLGPALPGVVRRMGWPGVAVTAASVAGTILFMVSLKLSSVAHVAIVYATTPFLAAALAWLATGERTSGLTLLASLLAAVGVTVAVGGSLSEGYLIGDLLALAMTLAFAAVMVLLRRHSEVPMIPAAGLAALGSAAVGGSLCGPLETTPGDVLCLALAGALQTGVGDVLFTRGAQAVPAAQTALIGTLEGPLAALWVWLVVGETPNGPTLLGGGIVLGAVVGHLSLEHGAATRLGRALRRGRLGHAGAGLKRESG